MLADLPKEIFTPRLILRGADISFVNEVHQAFHASWEDMHRWASWADDPAHHTLENARRDMQTAMDNFRFQGDRIYYYAFARDTGRFTLMCGIWDIKWRLPAAEIGYWADSREAGHGYTQEALNALARFCFTELGMKRLSIKIAEDNAASRHVATKTGFVEEGYHPLSGMQGNGTPMNMYSYGLLDINRLPPLEVGW